MKKLVYITNARLPTEKAHGYQICKMCEAFAENGFDVVLLCPNRVQHDRRLAESTVFDYYGISRSFRVEKIKNLDVIRFEPFVPAAVFRVLFFLHAVIWGFLAVRAAKKERGDLYFTREITTAYWLVRLCLPAVCEIHTIPGALQKRLLCRIMKSPCLLRLIVLTSHLRDRIAALCRPGTQIDVLPDAVDLSFYKDLPSRDECRKMLGIPADRAVIGYIGRFQTMELEKGIPELIEAMAHIGPVAGREPLLLCVGGPLEPVQRYQDHARRHGVSHHSLMFVDRVPNEDVPKWIRGCDVVTIPWPWTDFSAYCTSPMKLFEYMAAEVPIVASDLPALRDVLHHGENCLLVKPGNGAALAEAIMAVLSDEERGARLAGCAAEEVVKYTWYNRCRYIIDTCTA